MRRLGDMETWGKGSVDVEAEAEAEVKIKDPTCLSGRQGKKIKGQD